MLKFVYKKTEYSWEEWHKQKNSFISNLELPKELIISPLIISFAAVHDPGYSIAMYKMSELYHVIASARFALIQAYEKFYDSNIVLREQSYVAQTWTRSQFLKNSILWYNSCIDYICQILWFGFDMHGQNILDKIKSKTDFEKMLREVTLSEVTKKLKGIKEVNQHAKDLLDKLIKYQKESKCVNNYANAIKHRGNIGFKGIDSSSPISYENKVTGFDLEYIEPDILDIDETVERLARVHRKLISLAKYINHFMNFDAMFKCDKEGNILFNEAKDPKEYKKIVISNQKQNN